MNNSNVHFVIAKTFEEIVSCFNIRAIVFCEEQGISYKAEFEMDEFSALHVLGLFNDEPIAVGKVKIIEGKFKFERIAVRKQWRKIGVGSSLVKFMLKKSKEMGINHIKIHSQSSVANFYENLGFYKKGEPFFEVGIEHILMETKL